MSPIEPGPQTQAVRMRILVDDKGQVVDLDPSSPGQEQFDTARKILQDWTIRPARWGALPIASYLEVDVPLSAPPIAWSKGDSAQR
jgi:hypothetical protein